MVQEELLRLCGRLGVVRVPPVGLPVGVGGEIVLPGARRGGAMAARQEVRVLTLGLGPANVARRPCVARLFLVDLLKGLCVLRVGRAERAAWEYDELLPRHNA